jgi:hypothetical protein
MQLAGQMLPTGNVNATGPLWLAAVGQMLDHVYNRSKLGGNFFKRIGWRSGVVGIGRLRLPNSPGWLVLVDDNPGGTTLDPSTPTAGHPPTAPPGAVTIAAIGASQAVGPVAVSGTVTPNAPVQCAQVVAGVPGGFTAMTVTGTTWSGNVTCTAGSRQIRVRLTNAAFTYHDSNTFTVA